MDGDQHRSGGDDRLPETYDEFIAHPMARRRAIYQDLSPRTRSRLWAEQLARYRAAHPDLTEEQRRILDEAQEIINDEETFAPRGEPHPGLDRLGDAAVSAFGWEEARRLMATLGPEEPGGSCGIA
ncbi:bacteriocin fulvocin C-related protein [Nonomuraea sp. NPDC048826]|uniref:bacteriocin fulvocin C-related protein n=1 Tax=Nonomuraea sp. NPDC048826 TaxID=3364347 RepID=UPI003717970F